MHCFEGFYRSDLVTACLGYLVDHQWQIILIHRPAFSVGCRRQCHHMFFFKYHFLQHVNAESVLSSDGRVHRSAVWFCGSNTIRKSVPSFPAWAQLNISNLHMSLPTVNVDEYFQLRKHKTSLFHYSKVCHYSLHLGLKDKRKKCFKGNAWTAISLLSAVSTEISLFCFWASEIVSVFLSAAFQVLLT